ncbi:MAG: amidohydrolase family protein, partial [Candidatus Taylorbacteria bacterium]
RMGVTTGVAGNCGILRQDVGDFLRFIDAHGAPINYASFVGHAYLRAKAGNEDLYAKTSGVAFDRMKLMCNRALTEGAVGISFGLEYAPGTDTDEAIKLSNAVKENVFLLSAHYRKDVDQAVPSVRELIEISRETDLPMQISHIGSCAAFGQMSDTLSLLGEAVKSGVDIAADCYPYAAFCTMIGSAIFDEGCFESWGCSYDSILLTESPYRNVRCDKKLFYKVRQEFPDMTAVAFVMDENEVAEAIRSPLVMLASDGIMRKSQGHPRAAGAFPRILGRYVRKMKVLTLMEALRKMTSMPAERLGLKRKGRIAEGMDADLVIFDPLTIIDNATFDSPAEMPSGIQYVILDGKIAVHNNQILRNRLGCAIRRQELQK